MMFGAHMSAAGGPAEALRRGLDAGCDIVQLFVKSNRQWFGRPFTNAEVADFQRALAAAGLAAVFAHAGYLINLAAPPGPNRDRSLRSLVAEIKLADQLELPFLVLHPGAHLGAGETVGIRRVIAGLNKVIAATRETAVRIALENTAGQGTALGHTLAHHAAIYAGVNRPERLGLCLDTCHYFAAGYPIHTPAGWRRALREIADSIGLDQVLAFHLNDSKGELGSRVDRHEHIGRGHIGLEGFRHIVCDRRFRRHPGCLETPKSKDLHEDRENLARLRELAAG